jgi:N-acyl amino acid synthase FeeM
MLNVLPTAREVDRNRGRRVFERVLRGYRFRVCQTPDDVAKALDVRRRVYRDDCGYDVSVPDEYDCRSWLLLAENAVTGEAVGSMRVTPRSYGRVEAEECFELPAELRVPSTVEITRFAILPAYRNQLRILPVVAAGLVKLAILFMQRIEARRLVVCARPERVWTYSWLNMTATGRKAHYRKLDGAEHELLTCDLLDAVEGRNHRYKEVFLRVHHPEIELPEHVTPLVAEPRRALGAGR